jgi:hypothetical protein
MKDEKAYVRIKNGIYRIRFINPSTLEILGETKFESKGLRNENEVILPAFRDDIIVEITEETAKEKTVIDGTL